MRYGTTFSDRQATQLGLEPQLVLSQLLTLPLTILRLPVYWSTVASEPDELDLTQLEAQLQLCQQAGKQVVVTIGMKAPRWPEFYLPAWCPQSPADRQTQLACLDFITRVVQKLQPWDCIHWWQLENEPLDPSGPREWTIPAAFLTEEVALVRQLDPRPVIVTLWGNQLKRRGQLDVAAAASQVLGLDLYPRQYARRFGRQLYLPPEETMTELQEMLAPLNQPVWLTELQAEPWEKDQASYLAARTPSLTPELLIENWQWAVQLPVQVILLWGGEYWFWRARAGDPRYLEVVRELLTRH